MGRMDVSERIVGVAMFEAVGRRQTILLRGRAPAVEVEGTGRPSHLH